jgi:TPR repeat protein
MERNRSWTGWFGLALGAWTCLGLGLATPTGAALYRATAAAREKDYARAFELFRNLAEIGNVHAQEMLAVFYVDGQGVTRDNVLGYAWAKLALEHGGGEAARNIVSQLEPHLNDAARARIAAVEAQFGQVALKATLLPESTSLKAPIDPASACRMRSVPDPDRYYPIEAKRKQISGEVLVQVRVEADGSMKLPRAWYSFPADIFEEAGRAVALHSTYEPRIQNGEPQPCIALFKVKFSSGGFGKERAKPASLKVVNDLRAKAQAGDPNAQLYYGVASSLHPEYAVKDDATDWFLRAAQAGVPAAQYLVGVRLLARDTRPQEPAKGVRWLELASRGGSGPAMAALGSHLLAQDAAKREEGFEWLRRSAETNHREGKYLYAAVLASWPDVTKRDPARALEIMKEIGESFDYDPLSFEIRAASHAAMGNFTQARRYQVRALEIARRLQWNTDSQQARLAAYESKTLPTLELVDF